VLSGGGSEPGVYYLRTTQRPVSAISQTHSTETPYAALPTKTKAKSSALSVDSETPIVRKHCVGNDSHLLQVVYDGTRSNPLTSVVQPTVVQVVK